MGPFAKGTVVLVPFPFSDLSRSKLRPAVVLSHAGRGDFVLCQVTSNPYGDSRVVVLNEANFSRGDLAHTSYARPTKLFTVNKQLFVSDVGQLNEETTGQVIEAIIQFLRGPD